MKNPKEEEIQACYDENEVNLAGDLCSEDSSISQAYKKDIYIYGWGKNKYGELGLNNTKNAIKPSPINTLQNIIINSVECGGRNTLILTSDGKIYMCGSNIFGLLANKNYHNNEQYQKTFKLLKFFEEENIKQIAVAEFHSLVLNKNGEIYGWGGNLYNKLGTIKGLSGEPSKIFIKKKIISISCGDYHSCALSENGVLYTWGGGGESYNKGQCGHGTKKDIDQPKKVNFFIEKNLHIIKVSCGGYHTIVIVENGELYGFGKGMFGQCGYGIPEDTTIPKKVKFDYKNIKIIDIKCGGEHSIFLTNDGKVYSCGHGYFGQLGLGNNKNVKAPILVQSLSNKKVIEIAAGWSHTIILTNEKNVYITGCGKFGELGIGENTNRYKYVWLKSLGIMNVKHIFAGGHHSWCIIDEKIPTKNELIEPEPLEKANYTMKKRKFSGMSEDINNVVNKTILTDDGKRNKSVDAKKMLDKFNDKFSSDNEEKEFKKMIDNPNNIDDVIDYFDKIGSAGKQTNRTNSNYGKNVLTDNNLNKISDFDSGNISGKNNDNNNDEDDINKMINDANSKYNDKFNSNKDDKDDNENNDKYNSNENDLYKYTDQDQDNIQNINSSNNENNNEDNNPNNNYYKNDSNVDDLNNIGNDSNNNNFDNKSNNNNFDSNNNGTNNFDKNNGSNNFDNDNNNFDNNNNNFDSNNNDSNKFDKNYSNNNSNKNNNSRPMSRKSNNSNPQNSRKNIPNDNNNQKNNLPVSNNNLFYRYSNQINLCKVQLQILYSELKLSHRFIRFEISNTNKYYNLDFNSIKNMIYNYLSKDRCNVNYKIQNDKEAEKNPSSMVDNLFKEMKNLGLLNSNEFGKKSYTIGIVYDYSKNEILKKLKEECDNNYEFKGNFMNFKILDENTIMSDDKESILSKWSVDFYETFNEMFVIRNDNIIDDDLYESNNNEIKFNRPRFLELRPKIFK